MAYSFICPTELLAFADQHSEFLYHSACALIFISTDSEHVLRTWNATSVAAGGLGGIHLPLLSDRNHNVSASYGVLDEEEGVARRATFLIDPLGMIRYSAVHDRMVGRSVGETKRVLNALQFADEYGEGCPSDWQKGMKGVRMDVWDYVPPEHRMGLVLPNETNGEVEMDNTPQGGGGQIQINGLQQQESVPASADISPLNGGMASPPPLHSPPPSAPPYLESQQVKPSITPKKPKRPNTLRRLNTSYDKEQIRNLDQQVVMKSMDEVTPPAPEKQLLAKLEKERQKRLSGQSNASAASGLANGYVHQIHNHHHHHLPDGMSHGAMNHLATLKNDVAPTSRPGSAAGGIIGGGGGSSAGGHGTSATGSTSGRSSWASGGWASVLSPAGRKFSVISQASVRSGLGSGARRESITE